MDRNASTARQKPSGAAGKRPHKGAGHRSRLRERFRLSGLDGFHDYEVIELLLTLATPRKDCKDSAKAALKKFKTLQGVFQASPEELCTIKGLGPKNILGLRLVKAVADRYARKRLLKTNPLKNAAQLFDFLKQHIRDRRVECFEAIFLDAKNRVIASQTLFSGTLTASAVYPREVIRSALACDAAAIIFAHNHPSGDPTPSQEDLAITRQLVFACRPMGITVHEHIIIGAQGYVSFADQGLIAAMNREYDMRPL